MRGSAVVKIWPNVGLVMFVSGLLNSGWLKRLKNSKRSSSLTFSCHNAVVFDTAKSTLVRPGPRRKLRGTVPYVARAGFATTWASDGKTVGPGVHGSGSLASPHCALLKLVGLK